MDNNLIFIKTRELGEAINSSAECVAMREAEEAVRSNPIIGNGIERFMAHQNAMQSLINGGEEMEGATEGAIEALRLHRDSMKAIQDELNAMPEYAAMQKARGEFQSLISQVNQVLGFIVRGETESIGSGSCGGSCEGCSGCAGRG